MKKVGIITIVDYKNYGNRLQNYAVQETIKSLGFDAETILTIGPRASGKMETLKWRLLLIKRMSFKTLIYKILKNLGIVKKPDYRVIPKDPKRIELDKAKSERFKKFTKKYIKETDFTMTCVSIPKNLEKQYHSFVVGSDQVWNPIFRWEGTGMDFLTFAPNEKRVAFSPSFGISDIKAERHKEYRKWLKGMHRISVREEEGADIVEQLTGVRCPVLVDPTMNISKKQWLEISKPHDKKPSKKYLLTYILNDSSSRLKEITKNIAEKYNLEIVELKNLNDEDRYTADPAEFLDYMNSAELVLTNSFHATVFSIIFKTPFIVFDRDAKDDMNSRITTILNKFNLNHRHENNINLNDNIILTDYSHIDAILEKENEKTMHYLKDALSRGNLKY